MAYQVLCCPILGGTPSLSGGTPISGWGVPPPGQGYQMGVPPSKDGWGMPPHPRLDGGTPHPRLDLGTPCPRLDGGLPIKGWMGVPQSKAGWGTPPSKARWGTPWLDLTGVPLPPCGQTDGQTHVKTLPSHRITYAVGNNTNVTFLYKIDIRGFQNQEKKLPQVGIKLTT